MIDESASSNTPSKLDGTKSKKEPKTGIIYLSTIPAYMNVSQIREYFSTFGKVGRVYLQFADSGLKNGRKQKRTAKTFTEGWVEFERKSVAKKVAQVLNNTKVDTRKKSKQYDCIWNIKYLSNFKWAHLNERLIYEKVARRKKLRTEIELAKKKANIFNANLDEKKISKKKISSKDDEHEMEVEVEEVNEGGREEFLQSLFL